MWNELLIALVFLQNESSRTLMAGLTQFQGRFATNEPLVLAGALALDRCLWSCSTYPGSASSCAG